MTTIITEVRNAKSLQADNKRMVVELNHPVYGWIPYGLNADDTDTAVDNAAILDLIGTDFTGYVAPPAPTEAEVAAKLGAAARQKRNQLLAETDYTQMVDSPVAGQPVYQTYRQALRDITDQVGFPTAVVWPTL